MSSCDRTLRYLHRKSHKLPPLTRERYKISLHDESTPQITNHHVLLRSTPLHGLLRLLPNPSHTPQSVYSRAFPPTYPSPPSPGLSSIPSQSNFHRPSNRIPFPRKTLLPRRHPSHAPTSNYLGRLGET